MFLILNSYKEAFITLGNLVVLFFAFNSGYRIPIDYRGFFTHFSPLPLYTKVNLIYFVNKHFPIYKVFVHFTRI